MTWDEHEKTYCAHVEPPDYAEPYNTYEDACNGIEFRELADGVGGFRPVSKWDGKYWIWRE